MNIYLTTEDGVISCVKAKTMKEALDICFNIYLEDVKNDCVENAYDEKVESEYYYDHILESCSFVGKLVN